VKRSKQYIHVRGIKIESMDLISTMHAKLKFYIVIFKWSVVDLNTNDERFVSPNQIRCMISSDTNHEIKKLKWWNLIIAWIRWVKSYTWNVLRISLSLIWNNYNRPDLYALTLLRPKVKVLRNGVSKMIEWRNCQVTVNEKAPRLFVVVFIIILLFVFIIVIIIVMSGDRRSFRWRSNLRLLVLVHGHFLVVSGLVLSSQSRVFRF